MGNKQLSISEKNPRYAGVLAHPTSFPSPYGIGDMGDGAYEFIDFLVESKQTLWQVLPIGPTGYGDSPYQAFSSFAGQPLIISPKLLIRMGLLTEEDTLCDRQWDPCRIDYGPVIVYKFQMLEKAFANFDSGSFDELTIKFNDFTRKEKSWLADYALFMATKDYHKGIVWTEWDSSISHPTKESKKAWTNKLAKRVSYYKFLQFIFYEQWFALKNYANERHIKIIGDTPIFVAFDSADVWANRELFCLDSKGYPINVAGVPPDYFSATGQLWGNPLYNWKAHKSSGYIWWIKKVDYTLKMVDILRIDHFRGFEAYWAVPYGSENAIKGEWLKGPHSDLFVAFEEALGENLPIIAEDLGIITDAVEALRDDFHLPGMKILQFAFESVEENGFLPHQYTQNSVCYTGTHDNDTTLSWYNTISEESRDKLRRYLNSDGTNIVWDLIRACFGSVSTMAVVPLQDIMNLDSWARMNTPGIAAGNWQWRYTSNMLSEHMTAHLAYVTTLYGRFSEENEGTNL